MGAGMVSEFFMVFSSVIIESLFCSFNNNNCWVGSELTIVGVSSIDSIDLDNSIGSNDSIFFVGSINSIGFIGSINSIDFDISDSSEFVYSGDSISIDVVAGFDGSLINSG